MTYHRVTEEAEGVYGTDYGWGLFKEKSGESKTSARTFRRTYTWNERNQLIASSDNACSVAYTYGQDGQRSNKYTNSSETLYFNKMWTLHVDSGNAYYGGQNAKNIYLGDTRIVTKLAGAKETTAHEETYKQYFYHSDHLGSASLISDYKGDEYQRIEYTPYGETWVEKTSNTGDAFLPYKFTAKEQDEENGLYYYGARYLDPKYNRWLSTDPALGDYIPQAPISDEARKNNQNLPGMGGIFNHINCNLYAYAANNPVHYIDPDGECLNVAVGAAVGFVSASATEIGGRMVQGQSFSEATRNTFSDATSRKIIGASTLIGAVTSGASALATTALTSSAGSVAAVALETVAVNTVAGAVDAGAKDVITKAIKGEAQSAKETLKEMGEGAISAAVFSGGVQGTIANKTVTTGKITNFLTHTVKDFKMHQPKWAKSTGVIGENIVPSGIDVVKQLIRQNENEKK